MDNDERIRTVLADVCQSDVGIHTGLPKPPVSEDLIEASRMLCEQNKCGCYGTSWTCPPNCGTPSECAGQTLRFSRCALIHRRFAVSPDDRSRMRTVSHSFQEICRNAKSGLERNGIDCLVMAGGPCTYCSECAYLDGKPCRFPDRRIPSVSVYGIDVNGLLTSNGIEVEQPEGTVTLFGVILY